MKRSEFLCQGDRLSRGWHERHIYHWYDFPGLYAIYANGALVYIGQSEHVERRLLSHEVIAELVWERMKIGLPVTNVRVKICYTGNDPLRRARESRLIARLQPRFNKIGRHAA